MTDKLLTFARRSEGAVAVWFAILLIPVVGFVFAAIMVTDYTENRSEMVDAMDAAGLAMARYAEAEGYDFCDMGDGQADGTTTGVDSQRQSVERYGREFFIENFPEAVYLTSDRAGSTAFDPEKNLHFDFNCRTLAITADAFKPMGGALENLYGLLTLPMNASSEISLPGEGKIEIALVLDYSGSMKGGKIGGLKNAVKGMLDELYGTPTNSVNDNIRMSIVPFMGNVNVAPKEFFWSSGVRTSKANWIDLNAKALWHGANFLHAEQSGTPMSASTLSFGGKKVNHFALFDTIGDEFDWKGCVEARPFPLDEYAHPPGRIFSGTDYTKAVTRPSIPAVGDLNGQVRNLSDAAWTNLKDPANEVMDRDPSDLTRPAGTTYKSLVTGSADSTYFVPWFYPDEPDCREADAGSGKCEVDGFPNWLSDYADSENDVDDLFENEDTDYQNRLFIPDLTFISLDEGTATDIQSYAYTLFEWRNTVGRNFDDDGNVGSDDDCYEDVEDYYPAGKTKDAGMAAAAHWFGAFDCDKDERRIRSAYVGIWNGTSKTYEGKYDNYDDSLLNGTLTDPMRIGPNYRCGQPLVPLTSDKRTLWDHINGADPQSGTNSAQGLIWGWHMLSPEAPYPDAADPNTASGAKWQKVLILMSDGENNIDTMNHDHWSKPMAYGYSYQDRLFLEDDDADKDDLKDAYDIELDYKSIRICHRLRAEGIKVYTVGYDISNGSRAWAMLQACAIEPEASFLAKDADALEKVFEKITSYVVDLHVSG